MCRERDLKLKVIEIYNSKLDGRTERKKFILDRDLLTRKEKKRTKEEREVANNMRPFARFHASEEHEAFLQGLQSQTHTQRASKQASTHKQRTIAPAMCLVHSPFFPCLLSVLLSFVSPCCLTDEQRLRRRIEQLQTYRANGIRSLADGEMFENEKRKRDAQIGGGKKAALSSFDAPLSGKGKKRAADISAEEERLAKARKDVGGKGLAASAASSSAAAAAAAAPAPAAAASSSSVVAGGGAGGAVNPEFDVSKMPGFELLSQQERLLCGTLQMVPQHYLMIKERLIRECFTRGFLKENQVKQLIKIDVNKTSKMFDFFVSVGWLNTNDLIHANAKQTGMAAAAAEAGTGAKAAAGTAQSGKKTAAANAPPRSSLPPAGASSSFAAPQQPAPAAARFS